MIQSEGVARLHGERGECGEGARENESDGCSAVWLWILAGGY